MNLREGVPATAQAGVGLERYEADFRQRDDSTRDSLSAQRSLALVGEEVGDRVSTRRHEAPRSKSAATSLSDGKWL